MDTTPLAERMRPRVLADYIGQEHLIGESGIITRFLQSGAVPSMILWGPPGVGKTTLAELIAKELKRPFHVLSAISAGVKEVREVINSGGAMFPPLLFIDEIHRFSKSQQDALLGAVERGKITLIGATTENPSFEVISALLSRCQVYHLENHTGDDLLRMLDRAMDQDIVLKGKTIRIDEKEALLLLSGGDARRLLNLFEMVVLQESSQEVVITNEKVKKVAREQVARYDKNGEAHYDIISAFIKSMRGSDPNAALYYLARMVKAGEDPLFIARRMVIFAAEDIGLADTNALVVANSCFQAVHAIGYPEARIVLSEAAIYLATAAKSNSAYKAIGAALRAVEETGDLDVPLSLRNAPTSLMKEMGYGKDYRYAHDFPGNFYEMEFMPGKMKGRAFYTPGENARENEIAKRMRDWWKGKYSGGKED
ncbi:MAG: replication-associated recombination protein A [Bacteroidota bacterium]|nr:replication-associated recombination protein A [Bacteroidota bacterium]MDX5430106.1 replication-associated recombination protein A [Bacteroidota bacterium]